MPRRRAVSSAIVELLSVLELRTRLFIPAEIHEAERMAHSHRRDELLRHRGVLAQHFFDEVCVHALSLGVLEVAAERRCAIE